MFLKPSWMAACRVVCGLTLIFAAVEVLAQSPLSHAPQAAAGQKCILVELYLADGQSESEWALQAATRIAESRAGVQLVVRSITDNERAQDRLRQIAHYYHFDGSQTPVIYSCGRVIRQQNSPEEYARQLSDSLQLVVYTRIGCHRCEQAKAYLPGLQREYPGLQVVYREITQDWAARGELQELVRQHQQAASSTPVFHVCNRLIVGFDRPETTGRRLEQILERWAIDCAPASAMSAESATSAQRIDEAREVAAVRPFSGQH